MNNNPYQKQGIEIDLKELLWKLLSQWKAVLLVSLIVALLAGAFKYAKDTRAYKAEIASRNEIAEQMNVDPEKRIADIIKALSDEDAKAVEMVLHELDYVDGQKEYMEKSILRNIDPTNCRVLRLTYDIEGKDSKDIPVLLQEYAMFVSGDNYLEAVGDVIDPDADNIYIGELVHSTSREGPEVDSGQIGAAFNVYIILPEDTDADELIDVSNQALDDFAHKTKGQYDHSLSIADTDISHEYDYDNVYRYYDTISRINNMATVVTNAENALTPAQKAAYESIKAIRYESNITGDALSDSKPAAPGFSKKIVVLGFIFGAFMYVGLYVVLLILRGSIYSAKNTQSYTRTRLLGEVYYDGAPKGLAKLMNSRFVENLRYRDRADQTKQTGNMLESLEAVCEHAGTRELTLFDMTDHVSSSGAKEIIADIADKAQADGISIDVVEASGEIDEKNLLNVENAVLVVSGDTKTSVLDKLMSLCAGYDVSLLGSVYMAEK